MMQGLSIIIPCYNEAQNLPLIWEKSATLANTHKYVNIILVNNGSTDNSAMVLSSLQSKQPNASITICTVTKNQGYGYGIIAGIMQSQTTHICWTHADLQTDINDATKAYELFMQAPDNYLLIKGVRKNRNWLDAFFTYGMQVYTNFKLNTSLHDINAQPKLFTKVFWDKISEEAPMDFSLDLYILYQAKKMGSIKTIDVQFLQRKFGEAKGGGSLKGKWKLIKRTFSYINELAYKLK